jgi:hypothetical protein
MFKRNTVVWITRIVHFVNYTLTVQKDFRPKILNRTIRLCEGCSKSNAPHFFPSETIYSECMKLTHSITGCFLYTRSFFTYSPSTSMALHQRETSAWKPSLYQLVSCSRSHVLTARITFLHFLKP